MYELLFWLQLLQGQTLLDKQSGVTVNHLMKYCQTLVTEANGTQQQSPVKPSTAELKLIENVEQWLLKFELPVQLVNSANESKPLGSGTFGHVRSANLSATSKLISEQHVQSVDVAIKQFVGVVKADMLKEASMLLLASGNPHIVHCYGFFEDKTTTGGRLLSLILERAPYGSLFDVLHQDIPNSHTIVASAIPLSLKVRWIGQMLEGLAHLHSLEIKHRDFKPNNLLVFPGLVLKITDFGFSRNAQAYSDQSSSSFGGTTDFIAPEILFSQKSTVTSDVWSFGVSLLYLFHPELLQLKDKSTHIGTLSRIVSCIRRGSTSEVTNQCFPVDLNMNMTALSLSDLRIHRSDSEIFEREMQPWVNKLLNNCFKYDDTNLETFGRITSQAALTELKSLLWDRTVTQTADKKKVSLGQTMEAQTQKSIPDIVKFLL